MSYEIVYDRKFIKVGENLYCPLNLCGANNCTMFRGNREVRERDWWTMFSVDVFCTKEELLSYIDTLHDEYELFKWHGKFVYKKQMRRFIENGINDAMTVEEYTDAGYPLSCCVWWCADNKWTKENYTTCRTTEELLTFVKLAKEAYKENATKIIKIEFFTSDAFTIKKISFKKKPCFCKIGARYLCKITERGYVVSPNKTDAMVIDTVEQQEQIYNYISESYRGRKVQFISAIIKEKPYCIKVGNELIPDVFVAKKTSCGIFYCYRSANAKHFSSYGEAVKYLREKIGEKETDPKKAKYFVYCEKSI